MRCSAVLGIGVYDETVEVDGLVGGAEKEAHARVTAARTVSR
jgi:hypothetical protein